MTSQSWWFSKVKHSFDKKYVETEVYSCLEIPTKLSFFSTFRDKITQRICLCSKAISKINYIWSKLFLSNLLWVSQIQRCYFTISNELKLLILTWYLTVRRSEFIRIPCMPNDYAIFNLAKNTRCFDNSRENLRKKWESARVPHPFVAGKEGTATQRIANKNNTCNLDEPTCFT